MDQYKNKKIELLIFCYCPILSPLINIRAYGVVYIIMKIFLDSSDEEKIEYYARYKFIDGVTTNPSICNSQKY